MEFHDKSRPRYQQHNNCDTPLRYTTSSTFQPTSYNDFLVMSEINMSISADQRFKNSSKSSSEDEREPGPSDNDILAQATEFARRVQPPAHLPSALEKPVTVPQIVAGTGQSFARCWSPALIPYNITEKDFVEFIDNLNVVATASPPLQVLDLVGGVLGMVPHHIFQLAGNGIQVLAQLGTVVVSKTRTDMYMKAVNKDFLAPRGLKATIMSGDALAVSLRLPGGVGKLAPITDENMNCTVMERRLEPLTPYISDLRFDVPPPAEQTTILARISAGQVKRRIARAEKKVWNQRRKQVGYIEKYNHKLDKKEGKKERNYEKKMEKLAKDAKRAEDDAEKGWRKGGHSAEEADRKMKEDLVKIEEERRQLGREFAYNTTDRFDSTSTLGRKDKESKQAMKALWIVIENL